MILNNDTDCSYLLLYCVHLLLFQILSLFAANISSCFAPLAIKHSGLTDLGTICWKTLPLTKIRLSGDKNCAAQKSS